jgi:selenocysteine lyase/cysteine desulfurase
MSSLSSLPALDWHAAQDIDALLAHNRMLTGRIFSIVDDLGLAPDTPREPEQRGGSVMLRLPQALPGPEVVSTLRSRGVTSDSRGQTLRLSPGVLTTAQGCDRLEEALREITGR